MLHNTYAALLHNMYLANIMLRNTYPYKNIILHNMYPAIILLHNMYPANIMLHMYFANIMLHKTGTAETNNCQWCQETDDTEHGLLHGTQVVSILGDY